ncbi:TPA: cystatin-like fold lipoprotein [Staphylococcus aureus]|uniref:cystatin-like fold lipoprotein n=1 Tax=Staphylococcus aureus TaxID=1280 RepID=UPI001D2D4D92|nr:cystatin-like fold lipoprotein [Staphylococcus aureus]CAG9978519.1 hypothetical protein SA3102_SA3102_01522 [Staphylococcus aureus]CAH0011853.1 hypothetical protein SA3056_SA3056_02264 [Staphylococcus aureus]
MTKRILLMTLILVISTSLIACGKKYDKEIEEVSKLEEKKTSDTSGGFNKYDRNKSNIYVFEDGKVIILAYKLSNKSSSLTYALYSKNETTDMYKEDNYGKPEKFMKENKPDYKEEHLKE